MLIVVVEMLKQKPVKSIYERLIFGRTFHEFFFERQGYKIIKTVVVVVIVIRKLVYLQAYACTKNIFDLGL